MKDVPLGWQLMLQVLLIALNAIFACAELAIISMNDNKIAKLAAQGNKRAVRLAKLTGKPAQFLSTIQVAITLSGFLGSAFAADNFATRLVAWLLDLGVKMPERTLNTICVVLITIILSYFTLIFGELVPKRLAMKKAEPIALGLSGFIGGMAGAFRPVVFLLTKSTNGVLRLLGMDPDAADDNVTEEEIRMKVDEGSEKGAIDHSEREWIQNIFEFDDITVGEICTHRTDADILWMEDPLEKWAEAIEESRHTLYPICNESVDDVVGILNTKDYFRLEDHSRAAILDHAVAPAFFVPESIRADALFRQMRESRNHFAVVLDEYGGVTGIITMNDLLEQLVGDLNDESDEPTIPDITQLSEGQWEILGSTSLDDVAELFHAALPVEEYDTFGGFILGTYGSIPAEGEEISLDYDRLQIRNALVLERRVEKAFVSLATQEKTAEEDKKRKNRPGFAINLDPFPEKEGAKKSGS